MESKSHTKSLGAVFYSPSSVFAEGKELSRFDSTQPFHTQPHFLNLVVCFGRKREKKDKELHWTCVGVQSWGGRTLSGVVDSCAQNIFNNQVPSQYTHVKYIRVSDAFMLEKSNKTIKP